MVQDGSGVAVRGLAKAWILPLVSTGFLILAGLFGSTAWAQSSTGGTVTGVVVDPQNAPITAAEVRVVDAFTNNSFGTVTNAAGRYIVPQVTPGTY